MAAAEQCPVCLETERESSMLPCRHVICKQCTLQLWEVQQASRTDVTQSHVTCPLCRVVHKVAQGVDVFLQEGVARGARQPPHSPCRSSSGGFSSHRGTQGTLAELSDGELKVVAATLALPADDSLEQHELLLRICRALDLEPPSALEGEEASARSVPLNKLSPKCLIALLRNRKIPYVDCVEKNELVARVSETARGSCMQLPPKLLKQMLAELGLGHEVYVDKTDLARRVMAARSLLQVKAAMHGCSPSGYCCLGSGSSAPSARTTAAGGAARTSAAGGAARTSAASGAARTTAASGAARTTASGGAAQSHASAMSSSTSRVAPQPASPVEESWPAPLHSSSRTARCGTCTIL